MVLETEGLITQQSVSFMLVTSQLTKPLIEKASFLGRRNGSITVFLVKEPKKVPDQRERTLMAAAKTSGIRVMLLHEGAFASAFSEVTAR
jgi:hypothetical protein